MKKSVTSSQEGWGLPGSMSFTCRSMNEVDHISSGSMASPLQAQPFLQIARDAHVAPVVYIFSRSQPFAQEHLLICRLIWGTVTMFRCECTCSPVLLDSGVQKHSKGRWPRHPGDPCQEAPGAPTVPYLLLPSINLMKEIVHLWMYGL